MNRRSQIARLLTGGLIGASTTPLPGDEHWDDVTLLLNGEDATIADVSSASTALTFTNPTSVTQSTSVYKYGSGSLRFTEGGAGGAAGNSITFSRPAIAGDFTIETWWRGDQFNYHVSGGAEYLWSLGDYSSSNLHPLLWVNQASGAGTNPTFNLYEQGTIRIQSTATLTAQTWHHVAVTRSNSTYELFIDGVSQGTYAGSSSTIPSSTVYIGRRWTDISGNYYSLNGHLDDFRFTPGVARYTANFTPPTQSFLPFATRPYSGTFGLGDEHWNDVSLLIRGDTLTDLSANGHTITNNGVAAGDTTYTKHSASGSMSFDGSSDFISITDSDLFDFGSDDFTIELWAYHIGSFDPYTAVFGNRADGNHYGPFGMTSGGGANVPNQMRFFAADSTGSTNSVMLIDPDAFPLNQWVHVAVTRKGTTFTLWINGQSKVTGTGGWSVYNASEPLYIGKDVTPSAGVNMWNGNIEDFRITKGVARYTGNFTPPAASLPTNAPVVGRRGLGSYVGPSYEIGHSLDLDGSNDYLSRTFGSNGSSSWTVSTWFKMDGDPATVGDTTVFDNSVTASNRTEVQILFDGSVQYLTNTTGTAYRKRSVAGIVSANTWHHVVVSQTSTDATVYFDGAEISTLGAMQSNQTVTASNSRINKTNGSHTVGRRTWASTFFDGKEADVHFIDGQALTASDFGETISGTWYPKAYSGTYGTNGFHLDFADNSTTAALGNDVSGNSNNFTVNNMTTGDQTTDVPAAVPVATLRTRGYLGAAPAAVAINPTDHFNTVLWTGDGTGSKSVTGVGFQPDFMWLKARTGNSWAWHLYDVLRIDPTGPLGLLADTIYEERDPQTGFTNGGVATIAVNGFTLSKNVALNSLNTSGELHIGFCLKAGGAVSANNNTDGSIDSTASANTEAGFSVVTFTQSSSPQTIGHGLSQAPELILVKDRDSHTDWLVYHSATGAGNDLHLNEDHKANSSSVWDSTAPTSSVFSYNVNSGSTVAYCFHSVPGFSKVGSFTGDGGTSHSVALDFRPAFLMVKRTDAADDWIVLDNARDTTNPRQTHLYANAGTPEGTTSGLSVDFDDTGFTLLGNHASINDNNGNYIYLAFAESNTLGPPGMLTLYDRYIDTLS